MPMSPSERTRPGRVPRRGLKSDVARSANPALPIRRIDEVLIIFPVPGSHLIAWEERFWPLRCLVTWHSPGTSHSH